MTFDQAHAMLGRLIAVERMVAVAADEVLTVMNQMSKEHRAEMREAEWRKIRPILDLAREMVGVKAAQAAVEAKALRDG